MKKMIKWLVLAAMLVMGLAMFTGCGATKVDLSKYVTIEVTGYDGYGVASVNFDKTSFLEDYSKLKWSKSGLKKMMKDMGLSDDKEFKAQVGNLDELYPAAQFIYDSVSGKLDRSSDLKNGDKIVYSWSTTEEMLKGMKEYVGADLVVNDIEKLVAGLEAAPVKDYLGDDMVTLSFNGIDGFGEMEVYFKNTELGYGISVDRPNNLKNGDVVTLRLNDRYNDDTLLERFGGMPERRVREVTVTGLTPIVEEDYFEKYFTIIFTDTEPNGHAQMEVNTVDSWLFDVDKQYNLSNGDVVTVTIADYDNRYFMEHYGAVPKEKSRTYTVEGLSYYAKKLAEIPEEDLSKLDQQVRDKMTSITANWKTPSSFKGMTLLGYYFLDEKVENWSYHNYLYLVYQIDVENGDDKFSYYYYGVMKNFLVLPDGKVSYEMRDMGYADGSTSFGIFGEAFKRGKLGYIGYEDLSEMYTKLVFAKLDEYTVESTVEE